MDGRHLSRCPYRARGQPSSPSIPDGGATNRRFRFQFKRKIWLHYTETPSFGESEKRKIEKRNSPVIPKKKGGGNRFKISMQKYKEVLTLSQGAFSPPSLRTCLPSSPAPSAHFSLKNAANLAKKKSSSHQAPINAQIVLVLRTPFPASIFTTPTYTSMSCKPFRCDEHEDFSVRRWGI